METSSSENQPKRSLYGRSPTFQWGVWIIVFAIAFFAWSVLHETKTEEKLQTLEGTLVDYHAEASPKPVYLLRLQKPDGTLVMFGSWEDLRSPKSGWQKGQPSRVTYDSRKKLYKVVVGDEVIQDITATQPKNDEQSKRLQVFAGVFALVGVLLLVVGYFSAARKDAGIPSGPSSA